MHKRDVKAFFKRSPNEPHSSREDAEYILEKIMLRKNWSIYICDKLQKYLEKS